MILGLLGKNRRTSRGYILVPGKVAARGDGWWGSGGAVDIFNVG
jgi:hypothetical protein